MNGTAVGQDDDEEEKGGCGSSSGQEAGGEMAHMEVKLRQEDHVQVNSLETEIKVPVKDAHGQRHDRHSNVEGTIETTGTQVRDVQPAVSGPIRTKQEKKAGRKPTRDAGPPKQKLGQCERCGYLSSQAICKACVLLEGLNKARPRTAIEVGNPTE